MPKIGLKVMPSCYAVTYTKAYSNDISLAQVFGIRKKHNLKQAKKEEAFSTIQKRKDNKQHRGEGS